ncbi:hypothetical protein [Propionivibrio soli]|uniref:hypothetical protein n=1 Tax=Propionivibrio soli TaxID=2976531 RepID=UPI0021E7F5A3|nr:hypothetical protein [Propionivibrio soli]
MTSPISMAPISAEQIQNMDLETAMMAVQTDRANNLEVQLKEQLKGVADRNKEIATLNKLLTELKTARPGGGDTDKRGDINLDLYNRAIAAGLTMPTGGDAVPQEHDSQTIIGYRTLPLGISLPIYGKETKYEPKQKTFDVWSEEIKGKIDAMSSSQQMDMLRLQSLSNKRNEAFEIMTNFVKKMSDSRASIVGNLR